MPETAHFDRHTYVARGKYSLNNPWGRVPDGGTLLCRFHELNDAMNAELISALKVEMVNVPGLKLLLRQMNLPALQWEDDLAGACWLGTGLIHYPHRPEAELPGFLWLHYLTDVSVKGYCPIDVHLSPRQVGDAAYKVKLVVEGMKALQPGQPRLRRIQHI